MYGATRIVAILLFSISLTAMAVTSDAERHKAGIVAQADLLFPYPYSSPADKPLITFDKDRESGPRDSAVYWFNSNYVVRLIFAFDGSLARVELLPEALLHSDSWTSVPDPVELGRGEMQQLIDSANRLRSMGDLVSIHNPPDACFQSGPNLYCGDSYELASVSTYCHYGEPLPHVKAVTIVYKQSVSGSLANIKTVSPNQQDLQIGSLWYRILKKQEERFAATVGSMVTLTTFDTNSVNTSSNFPAGRN
jgi:hypothetical protein